MDNEKIKVFVVDPMEVWRKILISHINASEDMEVVGEINSGQGSILMLDEVDPDVILLDVSHNDHLPLTEIIAQLRSVKPGIHIILCADHTSLGNIRDTSDLEIQDFIVKPYRKEMVHRSIIEAMHRPLA